MTGKKKIRKRNPLNTETDSDITNNGDMSERSKHQPGAEIRKGKVVADIDQDKKESDISADTLKKLIKKFNDEMKKRDEELESLKDMLQRRQADFENYKKRIMKSQAEQKKLAIKDLALDVLNTNDDLLRAVDAATDFPEGESLEKVHHAFVEGVQMISKQIEDSLKKYGIVEIDPLNREFDPCLSEAVEINESDDVDSDIVLKIYQKGFRLDNYVLRCAKVRVTKPVRSQQNSSIEEGVSEKNEFDQTIEDKEIIAE